MTETLTTSGCVQLYAGANRSSALVGADYTQFIENAEGFFSLNCKYDLVGNYATLPNLAKNFLSGAVAAKAAIEVIKYDMSGYTSRQESQTMLTANAAHVAEAINLLRDDKFLTFLKQGDEDG